MGTRFGIDAISFFSSIISIYNKELKYSKIPAMPNIQQASSQFSKWRFRMQTILRFHCHAINTAQENKLEPSSGRSQEKEML